MSFVGVAVGGAALIGSYMSSQAAQNAANTQAGAANAQLQQQEQMYQQNQTNLQPYMQGGSTALSTLNGDLSNGTLGGSFTPQDLTNGLSPSYNFMLGQGNQALQNSQSAQDGVLSGAALKGLMNYNQNYASTGYQQAYNNWLSTQQQNYGQLMGISGLGENAAAGAGNTGATYAGSMSNLATGAANASAAGTVGTANALASGVNGVSGAYTISNLLNPSSPASPTPVDMTGFQTNSTPTYSPSSPISSTNSYAMNLGGIE